jgi:hypothetical protein
MRFKFLFNASTHSSDSMNNYQVCILWNMRPSVSSGGKRVWCPVGQIVTCLPQRSWCWSEWEQEEMGAPCAWGHQGGLWRGCVRSWVTQNEEPFVGSSWISGCIQVGNWSFALNIDAILRLESTGKTERHNQASGSSASKLLLPTFSISFISVILTSLYR